MSLSRGQRLALPPQRLWVADLLYASRTIPFITFERDMNLASLVQLRQTIRSRPGWVAIFTKAYAMVAQKLPALRRSFLSFPWPYLYEHPFSVASVAIEREYLGENGVFPTPIKNPESMPLLEIEARLQERKTGEISQFGEYRRLIRNSRWPRWVRRVLWWGLLNLNGSARARYVGTFGISVTASMGASALGLIAPITTLLCYSPFQSDGTISVRLSFDHRVLDGAPIARALAELEQILLGPIRDELLSLANSQSN